MIRIRETAAIVTEEEFRAMHPETSFAIPLKASDLNEREADIVFEGPQPTITRYQNLVPKAPELINGNWHTTWNIVNWSAEQIAASVKSSVPQEVTMRQARLALLHNNLLSTVNTAVAAMTGTTGDVARIEWEYSKSVERHKELVASLTAGFGWSEEFVDNLFIEAATY